MKILIAEDDSVSRRLLEAFLSKWGYEVIVATNGAEAWRIFEQDEAPRLALLDWMMPELDGIEVCRRVRVREARPYVYMVLLTARSQKQDLLKALEAGADDYLTKPFDADELRARLHVGRRIIELQDALIAARETMRFQATHDSLTGVFNHTEILGALRRELSRAGRDGTSVGVIMADLDHFKRVNDTRGHLAGDVVLREAVQRMVSCVRAYDAIGRYGGEEFLVVVPSSDARGTLVLAERIRARIEASPIETPAGAIGVTASMGVALSGAHTRDAQTLLCAADAALYLAKEHGRNGVELAVPEEPVNESPMGPTKQMPPVVPAR